MRVRERRREGTGKREMIKNRHAILFRKYLRSDANFVLGDAVEGERKTVLTRSVAVFGVKLISLFWSFWSRVVIRCLFRPVVTTSPLFTSRLWRGYQLTTSPLFKSRLWRPLLKGQTTNTSSQNIYTNSWSHIFFLWTTVEYILFLSSFSLTFFSCVSSSSVRVK